MSALIVKDGKIAYLRGLRTITSPENWLTKFGMVIPCSEVDEPSPELQLLTTPTKFIGRYVDLLAGLLIRPNGEMYALRRETTELRFVSNLIKIDPNRVTVLSSTYAAAAIGETCYRAEESIETSIDLDTVTELVSIGLGRSKEQFLTVSIDSLLTTMAGMETIPVPKTQSTFGKSKAKRRLYDIVHMID